jgi:hypothetical protein
MPLQIYTTQIKYTNLYEIKNNPDILDIDYLTGNKIFRPNRGIALGRRNNRLSDSQYKQMYLNQLIKSYEENNGDWSNLLIKENIILASKMYYYEYADRVLLAKFLENYGANYKEEIII